MSGTQEKDPDDGINVNNQDENAGASMVDTSSSNVSPIVNELLCYVQFHMRQTAKDNIAEVIKRFYSEEEVLVARDVLLKAYDGQFCMK